MAFGNPAFYNQSIRRMIIAFGTVFNNLNINRVDETGTSVTRIKVPISFQDKAFWYRKLRENIADRESIQMTLPRMSYDLVAFTKDTTRQLPQYSQHSCRTQSGDVNLSFQRVPYTFQFELNIASETLEDMMMILESIIPYFSPDFSISVVDHLGTVSAVPIILTDISKVHTSESNFDDIRMIQYTLSFNMKGWIYGRVVNQYGEITDPSDPNTPIDAQNPTPAHVIETVKISIADIDGDINRALSRTTISTTVPHPGFSPDDPSTFQVIKDGL